MYCENKKNEYVKLWVRICIKEIIPLSMQVMSTYYHVNTSTYSDILISLFLHLSTLLKVSDYSKILFLD